MRFLRNALLVLFLLGLVAFNLSFGLRRFEWRRALWERDIASRVDQALDSLHVQLERALVQEEARTGTESPTEALAAVRAGPFAELAAEYSARTGHSVSLHPVEVEPTRPSADLRLRRRLLGAPEWQLLTVIPAAALVPPPEWHRQDAIETIVTMVGVSLGLLVVGGVFLRLSARSFRLHETERYLRWIRRLTDRYRALMEGAADMILVVEPDTLHLREANAAARSALGLPDELDEPDILQRPASPPGTDPAAGSGPGTRAGAGPDAPPPAVVRLDDLFSAEHLPDLHAAVQRALTSPVVEALPEMRVHATHGGQLLVDARIAAVDVGNEHIVELSLRDLTHQKEIERRLQTAERLSSLGLLTAGVAHEINNPLEGIGNYLALLQGGNLDDATRQTYLERVRHGFERIRDIVRDLLHFSRPQVGRAPVDLVQVVVRALSMASYSQLFQGVEVVRRGLLPERPLPVLGDAGRLEQVVLNLLLNAGRATGQGRVFVSATTTAEPRGRLVELSIEDEGHGIATELLDRVFDPFFTTEGGTGLGLSISYGIVKAHGGALVAGNRPEGGARFVLRLPLEAGQAGGDAA